MFHWYVYVFRLKVKIEEIKSKLLHKSCLKLKLFDIISYFTVESQTAIDQLIDVVLRRP